MPDSSGAALLRLLTLMTTSPLDHLVTGIDRRLETAHLLSIRRQPGSLGLGVPTLQRDVSGLGVSQTS